jgi:hypothetical protein
VRAYLKSSVYLTAYEQSCIYILCALCGDLGTGEKVDKKLPDYLPSILLPYFAIFIHFITHITHHAKQTIKLYTRNVKETNSSLKCR